MKKKLFQVGVGNFLEFRLGLPKKVGVGKVTNFRWRLPYKGGGEYFQVGVEGVLPTMLLVKSDQNSIVKKISTGEMFFIVSIVEDYVSYLMGSDSTK